MKKFLLAFLFLPISVFAINYPKVLTLDVSKDDGTISYRGTTEDDTFAVMCKLYSGDVEIDLLSSPVYDNEFEGSFNVVNSDDYKVACANYDGGEYKTKDVSNSLEKYVVESDEITIEFESDEGHDYNLNVIDFFAIKDNLEEYDITLDEYNQVYEKISESVKDEGTLLKVYGIEILNENGFSKKNGSFMFKIKITDEMKKYNSFKLINIDEDDFTKSDVIELTVEGDYLVGTLPHLSVYALVGENVEESKSNPKTGDSMIKYVAMLGISTLGVCLSVRYLKGSKKN